MYQRIISSGNFVPRQKKLNQHSRLTSCDVDEVLAGGLVHLDVPVADVVLVPLQRHLPVHRVLEEHEGLPVAPALRAQAQGNAAPAIAVFN